MSLLTDIQTYLIAQGHGVAPGSGSNWSIFLRTLPDDSTAPDQIIALFTQPGKAPEGRWNVVYPRFSVYVRSKPNEAGVIETKMQSIFMSLHNTFNEVGSDYVSILGIESEPVDLGKDSKRRQILSRTFDVIKHVN